MALRETGCILVTEVFELANPIPHYEFHVHSEPPSGGWMGWTPTVIGEIHVHPRHPEVALAFGELPDDHPQPDGIRVNRDAIIECFRQVM
jgi:hypothetical protein